MICSAIAPLLEGMMSPIPLKRFSLPFDPHDMKYFYSDKRVTKELKKNRLPSGVRRVIRKEHDLKFIIDNKGVITGERMGWTPIVYFYTHKDRKCDHYGRRSND